MSQVIVFAVGDKCCRRIWLTAERRAGEAYIPAFPGLLLMGSLAMSQPLLLPLTELSLRSVSCLFMLIQNICSVVNLHLQQLYLTGTCVFYLLLLSARKKKC